MQVLLRYVHPWWTGFLPHTESFLSLTIFSIGALQFWLIAFGNLFTYRAMGTQQYYPDS